jgi:hypothetical protein
MFTIWKYTLKAQEYQMVEVPSEAKIISVVEQQEQIVVYALIDLNLTSTYRFVEFIVLGTGHTTSHELSKYHFLSTVKTESGLLMFHVFYR